MPDLLDNQRVVLYSSTYASTATGGFYTGGQGAWYQWTGATSAATVTSAWQFWNANATGSITVNGVEWRQAAWAQWNGAILSQRTKKQMRRDQAAQELLRREYLQRRAKEDEERRQAENRARALLLTNLTPQQRDSLEKHRFFDIQLQGKTYRIHQGTHGNVREVVNGRETRLFCAQPNGVPTEDAMLAQKLMLETDEAAFLRVANARAL